MTKIADMILCPYLRLILHLRHHFPPVGTRVQCSSGTRPQGSTAPKVLIKLSLTSLTCVVELSSCSQHPNLRTVTDHCPPHPYLSHVNGRVRVYLLSRIKSINSDIKAVNNLNSTVVCSPCPGVGVYFEGTSILAKVTGSNKHSSNAVLFSAHYDCLDCPWSD